MMNASPLVVFVHFGANPSPLLIRNAQIAKSDLPDATFALITTHPEKWNQFPGELIQYTDSDRSPSIRRLTKRFPEREEISRGYWLYTLERLFAFSILPRHFGIETPFLHIESDNFSLVDQTIFDQLMKRVQKVSVPRYSQDQGIASLVFSPNLELLVSTIAELEEILDRSKIFIGDMVLLGEALNRGIISELPTSCSGAWTLHDSQEKPKEYLIFDGLAIGQYLLGQDPFHTNGFAIPGHINEHFVDRIANWEWHISRKPDGRSALKVTHRGEVFRIANIHLHSKIEMPALDPLDVSWKSVIDGANGLMPRVSLRRPPDEIHTLPISLRNKFRLARRNGLIHLVKSAVLRLVKRFEHF